MPLIFTTGQSDSLQHQKISLAEQIFSLQACTTHDNTNKIFLPSRYFHYRPVHHTTAPTKFSCQTDIFTIGLYNTLQHQQNFPAKQIFSLQIQTVWNSTNNFPEFWCRPTFFMRMVKIPCTILMLIWCGKSVNVSIVKIIWNSTGKTGAVADKLMLL